MGSGPGTGSGGRGGGSAARGLALAEASPAQERPPVDVNDEGDIELAPLDFEEAVAAVEDQVVTKPEAARNLESLPEPGTPESGARLAAEFGIPITYMPAEQMRLIEIVAEMYSGLRGGKTYSPRLMQYYKALGGPPV
jgi:hypothetical protein